jgi:O-antigen/teichoic acid export membrane protein
LIKRRRCFAGSQLASVSLNLIASLLLIPAVGIELAAIGSALAYVGTKIAISLYLYSVSGLNVIEMNGTV